ncbi:MAG: HK97 family phage prohead protease [Loktanella sp.]|nr:HK97 family phage prohead protease [Loktanella sp.]
MKLEHKYCAGPGRVTVTDGQVISGYASLFGKSDQGGDIVSRGAYHTSLAQGRRIRMLWQHDPAQPIGIWDEVVEDAKGLWVKGRLLTDIAKAREAASLIAAGAIDGLSIGYRTIRARKDDQGARHLTELDLWEVSLVTFPMLADARIAAKAETAGADELRQLTAAFAAARRLLSPL